MVFQPQGIGLWSTLSDPRARAGQRAGAVAGLQGGAEQQVADLTGAFQTGISAADGMDEMDAPPEMIGDETGVSDIDPMLLQMVRSEMSGGEEAPLTSEDKGLALARMGFGIAGGTSPHALTNIGQGMVGGLDMLGKMKQQRALQRMREAQIMQAQQFKQQQLIESVRAAKERERIQEDSIQQRAEAAAERADVLRGNVELRNQIAAQNAASAQERAEALAEQRYTNNARMRLEQFTKTGVWTPIDGDEQHGIVGPPEEATYSGPLVNDPNIPLKDRNKLRLSKPDQTLAAKTIMYRLDETVALARELKDHPGREAAVGLPGPSAAIPGTEAWDFLKKLETLRDKQFVSTLQAIRDASKTGGAVGNVSDREGARFENVSAPLSRWQSEKSLAESLNTIIEEGNFLKSRYKNKYNETYGDIPEDEGEKAPDPNDGTVPTGKEETPTPKRRARRQGNSLFDADTNEYIGPAK